MILRQIVIFLFKARFLLVDWYCIVLHDWDFGDHVISCGMTLKDFGLMFQMEVKISF